MLKVVDYLFWMKFVNVVMGDHKEYRHALLVAKRVYWS
jgi:hypothetical protein